MRFKYYNLYKINEFAKAPSIMELVVGSYIREHLTFEIDCMDIPKKYLKIETVWTSQKPDSEIYDKSEIKQIYKTAK